MDNIYQKEDCFASWVTKVHLTFKNRLYQDIKQYNLTLLQRQILLVLFENHTMSQRQICEETISEASNMTATLKRMELNGYIYKVKHPEDKRASLIKPTQKALDIKEALIEIGNEENDSLFDGIDKNEKEIAIKVLKEIYKKSLQEEYENQLKV